MPTNSNDEQPRKSDKYEVCVPDYRGVEIGAPPRFRDPRNARRQMGATIRTYTDPDTSKRYWGLD